MNDIFSVSLLSLPALSAAGWLKVGQSESRGREVTKTDLGRSEMRQDFVRALRQHKII